jgi:MFS transporter, DHA1 family, multidrug resistance protein
MDDLDRALERAETQASQRLSRLATSQSSSSGSSTVSVDREISRHPTHVERLQSARIQHVHTVGSHPDTRSQVSIESRPLPKFGGGKPYPPDIPAEREAYVVDFESPEDPLHPMNWKFSKKYAYARFLPRVTF